MGHGKKTNTLKAYDADAKCFDVFSGRHVKCTRCLINL